MILIIENYCVVKGNAIIHDFCPAIIIYIIFICTFYNTCIIRAFIFYIKGVTILFSALT